MDAGRIRLHAFRGAAETDARPLSLDLTKYPPGALAELPLGPKANDIPLAPGGSTFNFRTDAPSAHVQVDRMRQPAVATALVSSAAKSNDNDDSPAVDGARKYVNEITSTLAVLANALQNDFAKAILAICARAVGS